MTVLDRGGPPLKNFTTLITLLTIACTATLNGINIGSGPFTLQVDVALRANKHSTPLDTLAEPICTAIKDQSVLEIIVDPSNSGEFKRFVIEPYRIGFSRNGEMVIQGYKVDQITLSDDVISSEIALNRGGVFAQLEENTEDIRIIRLSRIIRIEVLKNTHFKKREIDFEDFEVSLKTLCSISN